MQSGFHQLMNMLSLKDGVCSPDTTSDNTVNTKQFDFSAYIIGKGRFKQFANVNVKVTQESHHCFSDDVGVSLCMNEAGNSVYGNIV